MSILLEGEPVQWAFIGSTQSTLAPIIIFYPGTSTRRVLLSTEQFTFMSLGGTVDAAGGALPTLILKTPSTGSSTNFFSTGALLLALAQASVDWHDDGTGAMSGYVGVVPTVLQTVPGSTFISGTGLVTVPTMSPNRNPAWALLSNNSNATA